VSAALHRRADVKAAGEKELRVKNLASDEKFAEAPYPEVVAARPATRTLAFINDTDSRTIAEIGVYEGETSLKLAEYLNGEGELHIFDFDDRVETVTRLLEERGHTNVVAHGNSRKLMDSYNWSLMKLLRERETPLFDYVFIDGAHTWAVDALAFLLVDRLLKVGGYVDFDDYLWTLGGSPTLNPRVFPATAAMYTEEQISQSQVQLVVSLLVRRDQRYTEVVEDKIFRKIAA
jgi:predicted O-methyltransferase YrrM